MASEKEAADDAADGDEDGQRVLEADSEEDLSDLPDTDEQFCPGCSAIVAKDAGNCPECGAPIDELPREEKNPVLAAVLSLVFAGAGLGQIYNGQFGKGVALFVLQFVDVLLLLWLFPVGIVAFPIVWIYAVNDAYRTAERINDGEYSP
jgi:TM2 domain-containing membrane protein YozV